MFFLNHFKHKVSIDSFSKGLLFINRLSLEIPSKKVSSSKGWIAIFPILFVVILVVLSIWKRKQLKDFYQKQTVKRRTKDSISVYDNEKSSFYKILFSISFVEKKVFQSR